MSAELLIPGFGTGGDAVEFRVEWLELVTALTGRKNISALGSDGSPAPGPQPDKAKL